MLAFLSKDSGMQFGQLKRREFITLFGTAAATWPFIAHAQQTAMPVIGFMSSRSPEDSTDVVAAFRRGLGEGGFIEGQNVAFEFRWARGQYDRLPAMAADLVSRGVTVLAAVGGDPSALAAKAATSTLPILFNSSDPVKSGLVASLNRPGGNATGFHFITTDLEPKRLGLLHELFPGTAPFGALINPKFPPATGQALELMQEAGKVNRPLVFLNASTDSELDAAFATLGNQRAVAMLVTADPFFDTRRDRIVALAARHVIPTLYPWREFPLAGGLMSYGTSLSEAYRQIGIYAARILKGEKPAELPVVQSVKFELVINLKTAKTLGFEFPPMFSARADEVIE
jgi:putative ABC transport system substrate-binding protein